MTSKVKIDKNKLILSGCSISDYTKVNLNYGEILANIINYDYVHLAAGCGSNERIWRVITERVIDKTINSDDIVLIQYTQIERREFFSRHVYTPLHSNEYPKFTPLRENYKDGQIIKYKLDSDKWQPFSEEQNFFKLYEDNFISSEYNMQTFLQKHYSFLCLLKYYKIRTFFLDINNVVGSFDIAKDAVSYEKYIRSFDDIDYDLFDHLSIGDLLALKENQLSDSDPFHFSEEGHKEVALRLKAHLNI